MGQALAGKVEEEASVGVPPEVAEEEVAEVAEAAEEAEAEEMKASQCVGPERSEPQATSCPDQRDRRPR